MSFVTGKNWNFCHYTKGGLKGFISLNALPDTFDRVKILYCVTVSDDHGMDICQKDFDGPSEACDFLNQHYAHWEFIDLTKNKNKKGCSSCAAKRQ